jgi:peroxiredoxin
MRSDNLHAIPPDLPVPQDDGACDHLRGVELPSIRLRATDGSMLDLSKESASWVVVYCYPRTGRPDREPIIGTAAWNAIPGARGCTPQSCAYRDHHAELAAFGARVYGLSTQDPEYQREAVERLHLPFPLLSDERLELASALKLPTFRVGDVQLIKRLTLLVRGGRIEDVFYPVFPPDADAERVIAWLAARS